MLFLFILFSTVTLPLTTTTTTTRTQPNNQTLTTPIPYHGYRLLGTLGPYGEKWFPKEYKHKLRNKDRSSTGTPGVQILSIELPDLVRVGENITLTCHYRLLGAGQRLYTVNWWRDNDQFFTYNQHNSKNSFQFDGIVVDKGRSNDRSVRLLSVSERSSGSYKCEVMTEAPAFKTAVMYKNMTVVVPPALVLLSPPEIAGPQKPGQLVALNCTAEAAKPRAKLTWIINGIQLNRMESIVYPDKKVQHGRVTSKIGVEFVAPKHFQRGRVTVTCRATVTGQQVAAPSLTLYLDTSASAAYNTQNSATDTLELRRWTVVLWFVLSLLAYAKRV